MSAPIRFLNALGQAFATMGLYSPGHPSRTRVADTAYRHLLELQETDTRPHFSFLEDSVVYGQRALHEMRSWPWGDRLAGAGVERVEFAADATREDFGGFLNDMMGLLGLPGADPALARAENRGSVRYGAIGIRGTDEPEPEGDDPNAPCDLTREYDVARWLYNAAREDHAVPMTEAGALVRSLALAMHSDGAMLVPLLRLKSYDQYTAMHSLNVSVLVMAFSEHLDLHRADVHAFGVAGLLHDIGLTRIPADLLDRFALSREEQSRLEQHPIEGAKLLLKGGPDADIAAAAAYEHHMRADGGGYPAMSFPRERHYASRVVQVCTVYDALRNPRPFRPAWPAAEALSHIERGAGTEFDGDVARAFVVMMREVRAESRLLVLDAEPAPAL